MWRLYIRFLILKGNYVKLKSCVLPRTPLRTSASHLTDLRNSFWVPWFRIFFCVKYVFRFRMNVLNAVLYMSPTDFVFGLLNFEFQISNYEFEKCSPLDFFSKFHHINYPSTWPPPPHPLIFLFLPALKNTFTAQRFITRSRVIKKR